MMKLKALLKTTPQFIKSVSLISVRRLSLSVRCHDGFANNLIPPLTAQQTDPVIEKYNLFVKSNQLTFDKHQYEAVLKLNAFYNRLMATQPAAPLDSGSKKNKLFNNLFQIIGKSDKKEKKSNVSKSIYLYGGVGCGKTMLMDMCYGMIPKNRFKLRIHFNKFMLNVHQSLHRIRRSPDHQDTDPMSVLCDELVQKIHLLFFDEFQVIDIADAMLMQRLFTALFERGVLVFFTSNRPPNDLYKNGLQRDLFLPFIDTIYEYCEVICLDSPSDYRKLSNISAQNRVYFNSGYENELLDNLVRELVKEQQKNDKITETIGAEEDGLGKLKPRLIDLLGRPTYLNKTYRGLLDTDFSFMCQENRSAVDYIEFCRLFDTIVLRNIPIIQMKNTDVLRRFIVFIDTVYDIKVKLICSGKAASPQLLFDLSQRDEILGKKNTDQYRGVEEEYFAVDRTISRLIEIQSEEYTKQIEEHKKQHHHLVKF